MNVHVCTACGAELDGRRACLEHAAATGHEVFAEVDDGCQVDLYLPWADDDMASLFQG
jgi:hypothetical protein